VVLAAKGLAAGAALEELPVPRTGREFIENFLIIVLTFTFARFQRGRAVGCHSDKLIISLFVRRAKTNQKEIGEYAREQARIIFANYRLANHNH
jgi:hypothetical protein